MLNFYRRKKRKPYNWKKEHTRLWESLVPAEGQADTLQGELIRIAGKLTDQAFRNGNGNWDADHEKMWRFVGRHLDDPQTFSDEERRLIRDKIEEIIRDRDRPDLSGDGCCYYIISERVVDWCMAHPTPVPHQKDLNWAYTHDGETYRDERAYAAQEWCLSRRTLRFLHNPPKPARPSSNNTARDQKASRYTLERAALKLEADELSEALDRRERRLYGPRTFPLVSTLEEIHAALEDKAKQSYESGFVYRSPEEKKARLALLHARVMEACELVLWGAVEAETVGEIEARSAEVARYDEERRAKEREREERERREREERERAREERERERGAARPQPQPRPVEIPSYANPDWRRWPWEQRELEPQPPPDDGTVAYQQKLAHWRETGVWLSDDWPPRSW